MNKFLKWFGIILLLLAIVGLVIPNDVDVNRTIAIKATPEQIHHFVNNLEQWPKWGPWASMDPSMKTTIGEIKSGVGASQSWQGEGGNGSLIITSSSVEKGIIYDMSFEGDPGVYQAGLSYQPQGDSVRVTWYMTGEMKPIIIGNYFSLLMDSLVGGSFEQGLRSLKEIVEQDSR
jgi:hypothetical protein